MLARDPGDVPPATENLHIRPSPLGGQCATRMVRLGKKQSEGPGTDGRSPPPGGRGVLKGPVPNPCLEKPPSGLSQQQALPPPSPRSRRVSADKTVTPKPSRRGGRWQKSGNKTSLVFDASLGAEGAGDLCDRKLKNAEQSLREMQRKGADDILAPSGGDWVPRRGRDGAHAC